MKMRKLIAALICAIMCLAMLPAQASSTESVFLRDVGVTITLPESWYLGARQDGAASELAQALALDQSTFDSLFTEGLCMIACPDISATSQLQVIVKDDNSVDMRTMSEADKQDIVEGGWSAEASGIDVLTCEIYATDYTNYMKTHYQYSGFTAVQYATIFGGKMYMYQYCDYTGNAISAELIAELDAIIDAVVYGSEEPSQVQNPFAQFSVPVVNVVSTPTGSAEKTFTETDTTYIPQIGVTVSVPYGWYTGTYYLGADSALAKAFSLSSADIEYMYNSDGFTVSYFATPDLTGNAQLQVIATTGISGLDMRTDSIEWDAFMEGFLSSLNAGTVIENMPFVTGNSQFIKVYSLISNGSSAFPMLQYVTNFNGTLYIVQYFDHSVTEFDTDTIALIDDIVSRVSFD